VKTLKKVLRLTGLILLLLLALSGIGITGALFTKKTEQDYDNEIKTELVEGQQDSLSENDQE
jgi:hypothetical protein